ERRERPVSQPDAGGGSRADEGRGVEVSGPAGEGQGGRGSSPQELAGATVPGGHSAGGPEQAVHQNHPVPEAAATRSGQGGPVRPASREDQVGERRRHGIWLRGNAPGGADLRPRCTRGEVGSGGGRGRLPVSTARNPANAAGCRRGVEAGVSAARRGWL